MISDSKRLVFDVSAASLKRKMGLVYDMQDLDIPVPKEIEIKPNNKFYEAIVKYMREYIEDGVMPPDDVAPAILNLADDHLSGKQMHVRAGDYIMIQKHLRNK